MKEKINCSTWQVASLTGRLTIWEAMVRYRTCSPFTEVIKRRLRHRAWQLDRRAGDRGASIPSIENRLILAVYRAAETWNPGLSGYETWVCGAIDLAARKIGEELHRRNLRRGREDSLDRDLDDSGQSGVVIDLVDSHHTAKRFYRVIDLRLCYAELGAEQREIFRRLVAGYSRREIAELLGYSLHDFYESVWPAFASTLRRWFNDGH